MSHNIDSVAMVQQGGCAGVILLLHVQIQSFNLVSSKSIPDFKVYLSSAKSRAIELAQLLTVKVGLDLMDHTKTHINQPYSFNTVGLMNTINGIELF